MSIITYFAMKMYSKRKERSFKTKSKRCSENSMQYFGSSLRSVENRISWHKCKLKQGTHTNPELQKDYNLYGKESFTFHFELISDNDEDILLEEANLISKYDCYNYWMNKDVDWSRRNAKISAGHAKVRSTKKWKEMQSKLTKQQHIDKKFPCYNKPKSKIANKF